MIVRTERLNLVLESTEAVLARIEQMSPTDRAEISAHWLEQLRSSPPDDPWTHSFTMVAREGGATLGGCAFKGPPDRDGVVEIAYGVEPECQGHGYATEAASALVTFAFRDATVRVVRAHTLPDRNASTRVLTKCGFTRLGEVMDPEDGLVWRWEREREPAARTPAGASTAVPQLLTRSHELLHAPPVPQRRAPALPRGRTSRPAPHARRAARASPRREAAHPPRGRSRRRPLGERGELRRARARRRDVGERHGAHAVDQRGSPPSRRRTPVPTSACTSPSRPNGRPIAGGASRRRARCRACSTPTAPSRGHRETVAARATIRRGRARAARAGGAGAGARHSPDASRQPHGRAVHHAGAHGRLREGRAPLPAPLPRPPRRPAHGAAAAAAADRRPGRHGRHGGSGDPRRAVEGSST